MAKNLAIFLLTTLLVSNWIWPRFGLRPAASANSLPRSPEQAAPAPPPPPEWPAPASRLSETIASMQASPGLAGARLGFCVFADEAEAPYFSYRAGDSMTPASTLKALTSATAIEVLGPEFRFESALGASEELDLALAPDGAFAGDLILLGGGDPTLVTADLAAWVGELKRRGLKSLNGRIIADARCFPEKLIPDAWDWGDVSNYYGAGPSGLNLDYNRFTVLFEPAERAGKTAVIRSLTPPLPWVERHNFSATGASGSEAWTSIYGGPYASQLTFRGNIPLDQGGVSARGAIPDPPYYAARQFGELLATQGIAVSGEITTARRLQASGQPLPEKPNIVMTKRSAPLIEIIRYLHRTSDNMVTECVLQKLIERDPLGRSAQERIVSHWEERGLALSGLRMEDGSGLARADYIRPADLAKALWLTRRGPHGNAFLQSLNAYHAGRVRWKGGAMSHVRAYTGYTDNGYTFALMINDYQADAETLARWRSTLIEGLLALPALPAEFPFPPHPQT